MKNIILAIVGALALAMATPAFADSVTIYVGVQSGSSSDLYARLLARHIGKYLPGGPNVIVQNKIGAGGTVLGNYFYEQVHPDGKAVAVLMLSGAMVGDDPKIKFDIARMPLLGMTPDNRILIAHKKSGLQTTEDLAMLNAGWPHLLVIGASSSAGPTAIISSLFMEMFGARPKVISAYQGSADAFLALQRGEITLFLPRPGEFDRLPQKDRFESGGPISSLCQTVADEEIKLSTCDSLLQRYRPSAISTDRYRLFSASMALLNVSSPILLPPGTPEKFIKEWSEALAKVYLDPDFLKEAKMEGYGTQFVPAQRARFIVDTAVRQMREVKMKEFLDGLKPQ